MHVFLLLGVGSFANCNDVECGKGCSGTGCAKECGDFSDFNASYGCGAECSNPSTFCSFYFPFTLPTYFLLLKTIMILGVRKSARRIGVAPIARESIVQP